MSVRDDSDRPDTAAALAASEARYRDLWENSTEILYTHDLAGRFTSGNQTALSTYGFTEEEFLRLSIKDLVDPAHLATAQANMRTKLEGKTDRTAPYEILTRAKDGTPVWAEVHTRIVRDAGRPVGIAGTVRNISKRKAEEARVNFVQEMALELNRAQDFTAALQATLDRVCQATGWVYGEAWVPDGTGMMQCSPAWHAGKPGLEKFRHLSKGVTFDRNEGLAGELWKSRRPIWREDLTQVKALRRAASAQAAGLRTLVGVPIVDGDRSVADLVFMHSEWRPGDERWVAVLETVGTQLGAILAVRHREDQLRRQARLFTAQLRANPVPAVASDPNGTLLWANQAFLELAGVRMKPGARFGIDRMRFHDLVDDPVRLNKFAADFCEAPASDLRLAGRVFERLDSSLRDDDGPLGHVWYFRDVTDRAIARSKSGAFS